MTTSMIKKTYSNLIKLESFNERLEYLRLNGNIGFETFGNKRYLNQMLYKSREWIEIRKEVINRDQGLDLGVNGYQIVGNIYIHHIVPITIDDIIERDFKVFDMENLISVSFDTHNMIHYGNNFHGQMLNSIVTRYKDDTCPWK